MTPKQQIVLYQTRIAKLEESYKKQANEIRILTEHKEAQEKTIEGLRNGLRNKIAK